MASQGARIGKITTIHNSINVYNVQLTHQDITHYKNAVNAARSVTNPRRKLWIDLCDNLKLDAHLASVMNKRTMGITNKKLVFYQKNSQDVDELVQEDIIETPWFRELLKYAMESVPFGHSLIELIPEGGKIGKVELIDRRNVQPETGRLLFDWSGDRGIDYRTDPVYANYLLEVGGRKDYGLLMSAAPYLIFKRGSIADWSQFAELFGMPFRVGKYDPYDDQTRIKLNEALQKMGGKGSAVIPRGTDLEFHDNNGSGKSEVFKDLVNICDEQISKLFLGQTMTTDDGASRSQGQVHQRVEEGINKSDMSEMEFLLNWRLKPKLQALGYNVQNGSFKFQENEIIPLEKRIHIDMQAATMVPVADEHWYKTYGVTPPSPEELARKKKEAQEAAPKPDPDKDPDGDKDSEEEEKKPDASKKKVVLIAEPTFNLGAELADLYAHQCQHHTPLMASRKPDPILERIAQGIHNGTIRKGSVDPELYKWIADQLMKGVFEGFGGDFSKFYIDEPDYKMLAHLEKNVHVFSAFKTHHQLREATSLLTDKDGKIRPFSDFKEDILKLNEKYNVQWLQTEYNQAIASSQMASVWVDIEQNKDVLPLLQYKTVGDANVRATHAAMDNIIRSVNDTFWDTYFPPNDWGCRCDVVSLDKGEETDLSKQKLPELKSMFSVNTAKDGVVFPDTHPYYKVNKEDKEDAKKLWDLPVPDKNKKDGK